MLSLKLDIILLLGLISVQRLLELRLAERNRIIAMKQGGIEYGAHHYWIFVVMHISWMIAWSAEGLFLGKEHSWSALMLAAFILAQILRYVAIGTLGEQWNTRIIIVPGLQRVRKGIYRYINHPNYIAVAIELACVPLVFNAWRTAVCVSLVNAYVLLRIRIPAENAALDPAKSTV